MKTLQEAYDVLKINAHYSSGQCKGFVYLSQIEELLGLNKQTNQAEVVQFLLMNASRLDDEHFNNLMEKLEQWKSGRNKPKHESKQVNL